MAKMMAWMSNKSEEKNRVSSYKGYLLKLRRSQNLLAPQWGNRWFSIEGRYLKWYRTESDISPSGMVNLKFVRNISKVESSGSFTFNVSCPDRNLVLRCANAHELSGWMRALHMHADIARGGDGTNIVSDFNEESAIRNPSIASKKNTKLRASLTLEQEFDLNLKRLDALEKGTNSPEAEESVPPETHTQKKFSKPYNSKNTPIFRKNSDDYDEGNVSDVLGKLRNATSDVPGTKRLAKHDSTSSIEDFTYKTRTDSAFSTNSAAAAGAINNAGNRRGSKEYGESQSASRQRRRRERRGIDSEDEESDEFDTNSDGENSPQWKGGRGGGRGRENRDSRGGNVGRVRSGSGAGGGRSLQGKMSSLSIDSVESETFHYIPEVPASQNDRNGSNYFGSNNGRQAGKPSKARNAW